jgi:hypothetical protein
VGSTPTGGSSYARSSVDSSAALRGQRSLVRLQPGVSRGRSSSGRAPGRQPGEARSIRVVRFHAYTGPWCNGSTTSSNLVGPGSIPGGPASSRAGAVRLSGDTPRVTACVCGSTPQPSRSPRPRRRCLLRAGTVRRLSTPNRQDAGSSPARSIRAPVAQLAEQCRPVSPRPQQNTLIRRLRAGEVRFSVRAPGSAGRRGVRVPPGAFVLR